MLDAVDNDKGYCLSCFMLICFFDVILANPAMCGMRPESDSGVATLPRMTRKFETGLDFFAKICDNKDPYLVH